jgi:hypothetical protein
MALYAKIMYIYDVHICPIQKSKVHASSVLRNSRKVKYLHSKFTVSVENKFFYLKYSFLPFSPNLKFSHLNNANNEHSFKCE